MFKKYQHIERLGTSEVSGILQGTVHIFPKIDGTNASVWWDGKLCFGSRNRQLEPGRDNAGFMQDNMNDERLKAFFHTFPDATLYGEWLVPHSLKTYRDDAWRSFYVFDVMGHCHSVSDKDAYCTYEMYSATLDHFGIKYIPCLAKIENPTQADLVRWLNHNVFLIKDGEGIGEGIVIKNYSYSNRYGRQTWAKIVTNEFKEKHVRAMGPCEQTGATLVESRIVDEYCTKSFIIKTHAKLIKDQDWTSKRIPEFLGRVWHDFVTEETWHAVKKFKNPTINYKTLQGLVVLRVKQTMPELF